MELSGRNATPTAIATQQLELLGRMARAATAREIAALIVRWTQSQPGCRSAIVAWNLDDASVPECEPGSPPDQRDLALARAATRQALPVYSTDGHRLAIALLPAHPAALLLTI